VKLRSLFAASTAVGGAWLWLMASPAFAQDNRPATGDAAGAVAAEADPSDNGGLGEIVVTAQRRSENLQRAAIAITAVPAEALVRLGVSDTNQITRVAPALQVSTLAGTSTQLYLRGVGNFTTNSLSDAAVSVNLDGVAIARSSAIQGFFYDLERIEVLKGPQGTLYGRNATGGAVNIITAKPVFGETSGYVNAEYGNFDAKKLTAALNIGVDERSAIRVSGYFSNHDGYYSDGTSDDRTRAGRIQFASQLTDTFKLTLGADVAHVGGRGAGATVNGLDRDKRIGLADAPAQAIFGSSFSFLAGNFLHPLPNDAYSDNTYFGFYAQADINTPIGTLTILPAYRRADIDTLGYGGGFAFLEGLKADQTTIEARLASDGDAPLSYIVGLYYLGEHAVERANFNQQYFAAYGLFDSNTDSYAGFGRLTYKVTDSFRLTGGLRYTIDDKRALIDSYNPIVVCPAVFAGGNCIGNTPALPVQSLVPSSLILPNGDPIPVLPWGTAGAIIQDSRPVLTPSKKFKKLTYRVGVEYDLGPQSLLYASYETGFKSGGFFSSIDNPVYQPETINAITLGSKNRFLNNRLQVNIEGFWWNYKNQQVSHFRLNSQGGTEFVTENVGKSRIRGFEVEVRGRLGGGTTVSGTVQYLDAKYRNFTYANPSNLGPPVTGCAFAPNGDGSQFIVNCSGRRAINAPELSLTGGIEQIFDLGDSSRIVINLDGRYQSKIFTGFEQLPQQSQKGYFMADAQVSLELRNPGITISGFVNNLTDRNVVSFSTPHPRASQLVVESLRPPRTYGVRVGYKF